MRRACPGRASPASRAKPLPTLLLCFVLAGCASAAAAPAPPAIAKSAAQPAQPPAPVASVAMAPACTPAPLEDRAAAVLVVGMPGVTHVSDPLARELMKLGVGGVFLSESNVESARQVRTLVAGLQALSDRPIVVSTDEESGRVAVMREIVGTGPSPRALADEGTHAQVRSFAAEVGEQLAGVGVTLDLAPLLDLDAGPGNGIIGDRSFGGDPQGVAGYGLAFSAGLMEAGVTPTVKHFPGHGRSTTDTHTDGAVVEASLRELRTTDLLPFQRAIDAGAPVVMLNHLAYEAFGGDLPASVDPNVYALLREMGFDGVAITDSVGMGAVNSRWGFPEAAILAVHAGADAVLATDGNQAVRMRDGLVRAVHDGWLAEDRLSEAAARVTALAGGDPMAMSCLAVELPTLRVPTSLR